MSILRNLLNIIVIFCVCLNWGCTEGAGAQERESGWVDYHTIQLSSLFPSSSSSCVISPKASNTKSSLRVVHRHGPCSRLSSGIAARLDHDDILRRDQARVDSINSKPSKNFADGLRQSQSTTVPVKDETKSNLGDSGNYIVKIGIGTPKHDLPLIVDTGSHLTWAKCKSCVESRSCYSRIFNPSSSSSFHKIPFSYLCRDLNLNSAGLDCSTFGRDCCYRIKYVDNSYSTGFIAKEKFTLKSSNVFDGVHFGCGEDNHDISDNVAGVLGLSQHNLSFPSQTSTTYNKTFSYCLPSTANTGYLTFGSTGISKSVKFTPIIRVPKHPLLYGLLIVGITVGDENLKIPSAVFSESGAIIDSGTVITRLHPAAYAALRSAFKEKMSNYNTRLAAKADLLDTCYDFTGLGKDTVVVPKVSFSFSGGVVVELDKKGILYPVKESQVCLAFAGNEGNLDVAIFGSVQQKTLQVVYDNPGRRLGFAPNGCR